MVNGVVVGVLVVAPVGFEKVVRLVLKLVRKPWLRPTFNSGLPNSRPLSKNMPYPARTEVSPLPKGSQATPRRGATARSNSLPTLLPKGDLVPTKPLKVGGFAKMSPFNGL